LPDIVLAEPVGSCTDLVATVIRPLAQIYQRPFDIAPYGVILKPSHGAKILRNEPRGGFSPQAAYIFRKQIEEADFVIINRIDELTAEAANSLATDIEEQFPGRPVLRMSAKTGAGFESLCEFLDQEGEFGRRLMDVDYDVYAEGEAELGWLNSQATIDSPTSFDLDEFLLDLLTRLKQRLGAVSAETAHLKTIGMSDGYYAVANLVSSFTPVELSLSSGGKVTQANVVVNARVAIAPEELSVLVTSELSASCRAIGAKPHIDTLQSFRPGRPVPTHRILETAQSS
jgi:hypothetical protein